MIADVLTGARAWHVEQGDVLSVLRSISSGSIHCVVTSPPYFAVRDYQLPPSTWGDGWSGCLGLEPTPQQFVAHLVEVFAEVRRVLRSDGTCWINIGDSYARPASRTRAQGLAGGKHGYVDRPDPVADIDLVDGNIIGVPWMLALALRDDGWICRGEVVWHKPSPMPEALNGWRWERCRRKVRSATVGREGRRGGVHHGHSIAVKRQGDSLAGPKIGESSTFAPSAIWEPCPGCRKCERTDGLVLRRAGWRPTRAHEYILQLAKGADYYSDAQAVAEPVSGGAHLLVGGRHPKSAAAGSGVRENESFSSAVRELVAERNPRSVWTIQSLPFSATREGLGETEHYATFPPSLPERCIRASTSERGVCANCGAPWARVLGERVTAAGIASGNAQRLIADGTDGARVADHRGSGVPWSPTASTTIGWRPTCKCPVGGGNRAAVVLDPFAGSGTTGMVALRHGRSFIGVDLSPRYVELANRRIDQDQPLFNRAVGGSR